MHKRNIRVFEFEVTMILLFLFHHDALQVTDMQCQGLQPLTQFVSYMADRVPFDGIKAEFNCLRTVCTCDLQVPATTIRACVEKIQSATASQTLWLLPSFEGLQLGKKILEFAWTIAAERAKSHQHLEQIANADALCEGLEKAVKAGDGSIYTKDNITTLKDVFSIVEEASKRLKERSEQESLSANIGKHVHLSICQ